MSRFRECYSSTVHRITSRQNPVVKEYRDASRGEVPDTVLLDGHRLISEALTAGIRLRHVMVASDAIDHPDVGPLLHHIDSALVTVATASATVMDAVSPVSSTSQIVALAARPALNVSPYAGPESAGGHPLRHAEPRERWRHRTAWLKPPAPRRSSLQV